MTTAESVELYLRNRQFLAKSPEASDGGESSQRSSKKNETNWKQVEQVDKNMKRLRKAERELLRGAEMGTGEGARSWKPGGVLGSNGH